MLRGAADSLRKDSGRHNIHQMLFTVMAELLPSKVIHENISTVLDVIWRGLSANNQKVQESTLVIVNTLLNSNYTLEDIPRLIRKNSKYI